MSLDKLISWKKIGFASWPLRLVAKEGKRQTIVFCGLGARGDGWFTPLKAEGLGRAERDVNLRNWRNVCDYMATFCVRPDTVMWMGRERRGRGMPGSTNEQLYIDHANLYLEPADVAALRSEADAPGGEMVEIVATYEQARNAAIRWLEAKGVRFGVPREIIIGKNERSVLLGRELGVRGTGKQDSELRLDFDHAKGGHFNAKWGAMKAAFCFRATEAMVERWGQARMPRRGVAA